MTREEAYKEQMREEAEWGREGLELWSYVPVKGNAGLESDKAVTAHLGTSGRKHTRGRVQHWRPGASALLRLRL